ncbi:MAG: hypothetical protein HY318_17060 [Armatimonadetes bacterium]|nr:hypothetical protein [Armatimonadota bacterium]
MIHTAQRLAVLHLGRLLGPVEQGEQVIPICLFSQPSLLLEEPAEHQPVEQELGELVRRFVVGVQSLLNRWLHIFMEAAVVVVEENFVDFLYVESNSLPSPNCLRRLFAGGETEFCLCRVVGGDAHGADECVFAVILCEGKRRRPILCD